MLHEETANLLKTRPDVAALVGVTPQDCADFATLAGALMASIGGTALKNVVHRAYAVCPDVAAMTLRDITETARRNFEPGGAVSCLLFARGVHAVMAHRVAHQLWIDGDETLAMAVKSILGRALGADIHPAARIGAGLWLDHGLGTVIGETAVIEQDVSIWHNVTLGSTLADSGKTRHPRIGRGAVIGAGAVILGNIRVGAGANVAAGAMVLEDVADGTVVVGTKARAVGPARISFAKGVE